MKIPGNLSHEFHDLLKTHKPSRLKTVTLSLLLFLGGAGFGAMCVASADSFGSNKVLLQRIEAAVVTQHYLGKRFRVSEYDTDESRVSGPCSHKSACVIMVRFRRTQAGATCDRPIVSGALIDVTGEVREVNLKDYTPLHATEEWRRVAISGFINPATRAGPAHLFLVARYTGCSAGEIVERSPLMPVEIIDAE